MKEKLSPIVFSFAIAASGCTQEQATVPTQENLSTKGPTPTLIFETIESETEVQSLEQMKEVVENFTWDDFDNNKRLETFIEQLADGYIVLTGSQNPNLENIKSQTVIYRDFVGFNKKAEELGGLNVVIEDQFSATLLDNVSDRGFFHLLNASSIGNRLNREVDHPGYFMMDLLWNMWGVTDAIPNETKGEFINNPFFGVEVILDEEGNTKVQEIKSYFGGQIYLEEPIPILDGFHLLLNRAINARLIEEKMGIPNSRLLQGHQFIGVDNLIDITQDAGVSSQRLYRLYSRSNLEEIFKIIGSQLTDNPKDYKLEGLYYAIDLDDLYALSNEEVRENIPPLNASPATV